jgi:Arc/MetJ-type ribon-helix-helix transcriptional regulator
MSGSEPEPRIDQRFAEPDERLDATINGLRITSEDKATAERAVDAGLYTTQSELYREAIREKVAELRSRLDTEGER